MYYLYVAYVFLSGYALASLFFRKEEQLLLNLALSPLLGFFIPSVIVVFYNMCGIPIHTMSLWGAWAPIVLLFFVLRRKAIVLLFQRLWLFYKGSSRWNKLFIFFVLFGLFQFFTYAITKAIWNGDGKQL